MPVKLSGDQVIIKILALTGRQFLERFVDFFGSKYIDLDDPHKDDLAILLNNKGNIFWLVV
jgi:hypothetical protein